MDNKIQQMIDLYNKYGFNMPLKAKYKRDKNRIYFVDEFQDGEEIYFYYNCVHPSSMAKGNAIYKNNKGMARLINISELKVK